MMSLSGLCAIAMGVVFDGPLWLFVAVGGGLGGTGVGGLAPVFAVGAEVGGPRYLGGGAAVSLGVGVSVTLVLFRLTPGLAVHSGWRWSFLPLGAGPAVGVVAMVVLNRMSATRS